jgi:hypothetical protein
LFIIRGLDPRISIKFAVLLLSGLPDQDRQ